MERVKGKEVGRERGITKRRKKGREGETREVKRKEGRENN